MGLVYSYGHFLSPGLTGQSGKAQGILNPNSIALI